MAKVAGVLVAAALTVVAARAGACEEPLVVGYTKWPPFDMVESNRVSGINGDVLRAVAERMGCALRWRYRPWRRLLAELRKGELDVTGAAHRTEERQRYARFSESYMPYKAVLFVDSRNATEYATLHDFLEAGNHLAVVSKYTYGEDTDTLLDEPAYRGQVFEMYAADESVRALAHDRVDGLIGNPYVTRYFADEQDALGQIRATEAVVQNTPIHFMFSKKAVSADFVARFNEALRDVADAGRIDAILQAHLHDLSTH